MQFIKQIKKSNNKSSLLRYINCRNHNVQLLKKKNKIVIQALVITYGGAADKKITQQIAKNIAWHWNLPKAQIGIDNIKYRVVFKIKGKFIPSFPASIIKRNSDQKNIFIRIEEQLSTNISLMDGVCSNTGFFKKENIGYKGASTEAHEYGHALGLWPGEKDGHPQDIDQRGKGVPGIMYPRGSLVDSQYQWMPSSVAGEYGGTVMPDKRRVRQLDIDMLGLQNKNYKRKGTCRLGKLSNRHHEEIFKL
jgi:hypothetical protein